MHISLTDRTLVVLFYNYANFRDLGLYAEQPNISNILSIKCRFFLAPAELSGDRFRFSPDAVPTEMTGHPTQ